MTRKKIELGDEVQDTVSGFKGVVVSEHNYLHGCRRLSVQPKVGKDGSNKDSQGFDEPQLKILKRKKIKIGNRVTGGTEKYPDSRRE